MSLGVAEWKDNWLVQFWRLRYFWSLLNCMCCSESWEWVQGWPSALLLGPTLWTKVCLHPKFDLRKIIEWQMYRPESGAEWFDALVLPFCQLRGWLLPLALSLFYCLWYHYNLKPCNYCIGCDCMLSSHGPCATTNWFNPNFYWC